MRVACNRGLYGSFLGLRLWCARAGMFAKGFGAMMEYLTRWAHISRRRWKLGSERNLANHFDFEVVNPTPRNPPRKFNFPWSSFLNKRALDPHAGHGAQ